MLTAHAYLRGDEKAIESSCLDGSVGAGIGGGKGGNTGDRRPGGGGYSDSGGRHDGAGMGLRLRARAAADAARATDRSSIVSAARGAQTLLAEFSAQVRFAAAAALAKLAILLVAAEATFAAEAVAAHIGDMDDDDGGVGNIPRMRWSVDPDDWETVGTLFIEGFHHIHPRFVSQKRIPWIVPS